MLTSFFLKNLKLHSMRKIFDLYLKYISFQLIFWLTKRKFNLTDVLYNTMTKAIYFKCTMQQVVENRDKIHNTALCNTHRKGVWQWGVVPVEWTPLSDLVENPCGCIIHQARKMDQERMMNNLNNCFWFLFFFKSYFLPLLIHLLHQGSHFIYF